jgi:hypothetical protein
LHASAAAGVFTVGEPIIIIIIIIVIIIIIIIIVIIIIIIIAILNIVEGAGACVEEVGQALEHGLILPRSGQLDDAGRHHPQQVAEPGARRVLEDEEGGLRGALVVVLSELRHRIV